MHQDSQPHDVDQNTVSSTAIVCFLADAPSIALTGFPASPAQGSWKYPRATFVSAHETPEQISERIKTKKRSSFVGLLFLTVSSFICGAGAAYAYLMANL